MKKLISIILIILGIVVSFIAGLNFEKFFLETLKSHEYDIDYKENHLYAIQYLGYNFEGLENIKSSNVEFFNLGGEEYYLIIPRYDDMSIEIYQNDMETQSRQLVFSSAKATPFVVKGNESDLFPNITVKLTSNAGKTTEITPYISLKDGTFTANEDGVILNSKE